MVAFCEVCGKQIPGARRSTRKYCSGACRQTAHRRAVAAQKKAAALTMTLEGAVMLQKLRKVLPRTAASVDVLVELLGVGCTEAAVKLALTAYAEAVARPG